MSTPTLQQQLDALADDSQWSGGWYQPIRFPDGSLTHNTKLTDAEFYGAESRGALKWERVIKPHLPCTLDSARFLEIGCNAGLYLALAHAEGASVVGVENHPLFIRQARLVLSHLCPSAVLLEDDALAGEWERYGPFDLALLSNALYWMVYSDAHGFLEAHAAQLSKFLRRLAEASKYILVVGSESPLQYANLETSVPMIAESFEIIEAKPMPVNDRRLNIVAGRSRYCH